MAGESAPDKEARLRRGAVQIAAMLPDDVDDALKVLGYCRVLVDDFMRPRGADDKIVAMSLVSPPAKSPREEGPAGR